MNIENGINIYSSATEIKEAFVYELFTFVCLPDNNPSKIKLDYLEQLSYQIGIDEGINFIFEIKPDRVMGYASIGAAKEIKKLDMFSKSLFIKCLADLMIIEGEPTALQKKTEPMIHKKIGLSDDDLNYIANSIKNIDINITSQ